MPSAFRSVARHGRDVRGVDADATQSGCTARRPEWRISARQCLGEERGVVGEVLPLIFGEICLVVDRVDAADELAGSAVHTFVGIDVQGPVTFVDTVHRAFLDARFVHHIDARRPYYISHDASVGIAGSRSRGPKALIGAGPKSLMSCVTAPPGTESGPGGGYDNVMETLTG